MIKKIILLTCILMFSFNCKKKAGLYKGFVVGITGVAIYKAPADLKNKVAVLLRGTEFEVLQEKIKDPALGEKRYWYEVRTNDKTGFLSYDEALINRSISVFEASKENLAGIVTVPVLNLREKPSLESGILAKLPQFSLVNVLAKGSFMEYVKEKHDRWLEISTPEGKRGFIFAGFVNLYPAVEAQAAIERKEISLNGYFQITRPGAKFTVSPDGDAVTSDTEGQCGNMHPDFFPAEKEFGVVTSKSYLNGKTFYKIEMVEYQEFDCGLAASGWVNSEYGKFYDPSEFSEYSLSNPSATLERSDISALKSAVGNDFNAISSSAEALNVSAQNSQGFYIVTAIKGYKNSRNAGNYSQQQFILKRENGTSSIVSSPIPGELKITDLDGDGIKEVLATVSMRSSDSTTILGFVDGKYITVKSVSSEEGNGSHLALDSNNIITETSYLYDEAKQESKDIVLKYKYNKGKLIKL
ncbi:MAG: SH3 domain-containing protein [Leptospira sp.]|nr:SH3 domain-containing protein [Leptospira sp.]